MAKEKSAGAVIFRKEKDSIFYLVLNYSVFGKVSKKYWGLVKGKIEKGEKIKDTAIREAKEETGIKDLNFISGFKETDEYFFRYKGKTIFKKVYYLLAETGIKKIKLSREHKGFKWLPYKKALKQLTFQKTKKILKKANDFQRKNIPGS